MDWLFSQLGDIIQDLQLNNDELVMVSRIDIQYIAQELGYVAYCYINIGNYDTQFRIDPNGSKCIEI